MRDKLFKENIAALSIIVLALALLLIYSVINEKDNVSGVVPEIREYYLDGEIDDESKSVQDIIKNLRNLPNDVHAIVNLETQGGSFTTCLRLKQLFKEKQVTVTSKAISSSCGSVLLLSGVNYVVDDNTLILLHLAHRGQEIEYDAVQDVWFRLVAYHYSNILTDSEMQLIVNGEDIIIFGTELLDRKKNNMRESFAKMEKMYLKKKQDYLNKKDLIKRLNEMQFKALENQLYLMEHHSEEH